MKKKILLTIVIILALVLISFIVYNVIKGPSDSKKFKEEYEVYNNVPLKENKKSKYLELTIDKDNSIVYLNNENIIKEMTTGDKIIYFGYPNSNSCRNTVSELLKSAKDNGIETIYYYNSYKDFKDKNKIYNSIVKQLKDDKAANLKELTSPLVVLIKNGKVKQYQNKDTSSNKELYKTYDEMMIELLMCSTIESDC